MRKARVREKMWDRLVDKKIERKELEEKLEKLNKEIEALEQNIFDK